MIAGKRVRFRCPESHWCTQADYDLVLYRDAVDDIWELYSLDGVPTRRRTRWTGRRSARCATGWWSGGRAPVRPDAGGGQARPPGRPVGDVGRYRDQREDLPLLSGPPGQSD